jgi:hypothetical protein
MVVLGWVNDGNLDCHSNYPLTTTRSKMCSTGAAASLCQTFVSDVLIIKDTVIIDTLLGRCISIYLKWLTHGIEIKPSFSAILALVCK